MSILLLKQLVYTAGNPAKKVQTSQNSEEGDTSKPDETSDDSSDPKSYLKDEHLAAIEAAYEEASLLLRNFYKVWEKVT